MLRLPIPNPEPFFVRVFNPVFFDPFDGWDVLKSGEIIARAPTLPELDAKLRPEQEEMFDQWLSVASPDNDAKWSDQHGGAILEGHEETGFSFGTFWLVPPEPDFVIQRLREICDANPGYWQDWLETDDMDLPELSLDYIDRMLPVYHGNPEPREKYVSGTEFYMKVIDGVNAAAEAWRTR